LSKASKGEQLTIILKN